MVIVFLTFISTSGDANQPQMGTKKANSMESGPHRYGRVAKSGKQKAPDTSDHKVKDIGRRDTDSRADTCCDGKN